MQADGWCLPGYSSPESHAWPPRSEFCWLAFTYSTQRRESWVSQGIQSMGILCLVQATNLNSPFSLSAILLRNCGVLFYQRTGPVGWHWYRLLKFNSKEKWMGGWKSLLPFPGSPFLKRKDANNPDICITKLGSSIQRIPFTIVQLCSWISYFLYLRTKTPLKTSSKIVPHQASCAILDQRHDELSSRESWLLSWRARGFLTLHTTHCSAVHKA